MSSYVHYQLLTDVSLHELLRREHDDQLHASLFEPVRQPLGRAGGARRRALLCDGARPSPAWPAGRAAKSRENAPGYIFALSTLALAFVLYLGWASYFVLKTFCILCAITYVAVIAIFLVSGGATTFPMKTLPDRARRDVRTLVSSPLALADRAPPRRRRGDRGGRLPAGCRGRRSGGRSARRLRRCPQSPTTSAPKIAQWWEVQPKSDVPVPADGAKVADRQVQRLSVPGLQADLRDLQAAPAEVHQPAGR